MRANLELIEQIEDGVWHSAGRNLSAVESKTAKSRMEDAGHLDPARAEALRLVQQIFIRQTENPPHAVVFAAIDEGAGCSQICASVAQELSMHSTGQVCLVEANFREPSLPRLLDASNHYGLTNAILNQGPVRSFAKPLHGNDKLWLISSGALAVDSANLLNSVQFKARLSELRSEFEFVVVDAPPLTRYSDAIATGQLCDGIVLVLEAGMTRREAAQMATDNLRTVKIPILGAVLNNRTFPIPEKLYRRL
jgi:protein-tyrosine kinase